jgi:hypothetical protein
MRGKKHDHGVIERTEVITSTSKIAQFKYFLLVIDIATKKVISRFGHFTSPEEAEDFAKVHGIVLE